MSEHSPPRPVPALVTALHLIQNAVYQFIQSRTIKIKYVSQNVGWCTFRHDGLHSKGKDDDMRLDITRRVESMIQDDIPIYIHRTEDVLNGVMNKKVPSGKKTYIVIGDAIALGSDKIPDPLVSTGTIKGFEIIKIETSKHQIKLTCRIKMGTNGVNTLCRPPIPMKLIQKLREKKRLAKIKVKKPKFIHVCCKKIKKRRESKDALLNCSSAGIELGCFKIMFKETRRSITADVQCAKLPPELSWYCIDEFRDAVLASAILKQKSELQLLWLRMKQKEKMEQFAVAKILATRIPKPIRKSPILCLVSGDGIEPRLGSILAFIHPEWKVHSIDPLMTLKKIPILKNLTCHRDKTEVVVESIGQRDIPLDFNQDVVLLVSVHGHAPFNAVKLAIQKKFPHAILLSVHVPCCSQQRYIPQTKPAFVTSFDTKAMSTSVVPPCKHTTGWDSNTILVHCEPEEAIVDVFNREHNRFSFEFRKI